MAKQFRVGDYVESAGLIVERGHVVDRHDDGRPPQMADMTIVRIGPNGTTKEFETERLFAIIEPESSGTSGE